MLFNGFLTDLLVFLLVDEESLLNSELLEKQWPKIPVPVEPQLLVYQALVARVQKFFLFNLKFIVQNQIQGFFSKNWTQLGEKVCWSVLLCLQEKLYIQVWNRFQCLTPTLPGGICERKKMKYSIQIFGTTNEIFYVSLRKKILSSLFKVFLGQNLRKRSKNMTN